ncbi:MAG: mechanosensitive ion channel [Muribaculaceae bacterium]|nr:mechanosensitive ion channel [Muribaculaceae bacterium]
MILNFLQSLPLPTADDSIPSVKEDLKQLPAMSLDDLLSRFTSTLVDFAIHLAIAIVVFYVGKLIINKLYSLVSSIMIRRKVDRSLTTFVLSLIKIVLFFILIVTVIGIIGIETSSFIAIFASAGVAIGMALSGTLQNFAGGVLILLLKPYKIGDYIEAQGFAGTVTEIQIFHTIISTPDNKSIIIPNGGLSTGSINNYSREAYRRVDWTVSISYGNDVDKAREVIMSMFADDDRIVTKYIEDDEERRYELAETEAKKATMSDDIAATPKKAGWFRRLFQHKKVKSRMEEWKESKDARIKAMLPKADRSPQIYLSQLADSSVNLSCRVWTRSEYYWDVYFSINERIYKELPSYGISFPFPQMDVHIRPHDA